MQDKIKRLVAKTYPAKIPAILRIFMKDEAIGGKLILGAAICALVVANSPLRHVYETFWHQGLSIGVNESTITMDLRHWLSEGLMALFFLVVGLEIKREIIKGHLRHIKSAILPIGAAIGGMAVPALLFLAINNGYPDNAKGWAIPIATDIAFALAVISLLGNRVSSSLKVFLLTLSIVDDIVAILIIGLFYGDGFKISALLLALLIAVSLAVFSRSKLMNTFVFSILGVGLWITVYKSGVHASIAGALLGFLAPLSANGVRVSVAEKIEKLVLPSSTFLVVPLFAFASFGVTFSTESLAAYGAFPLMLGIILGLVAGKVIGISLISLALVKSGKASLPAENTVWSQLMGVGFVAGIGFTVSVFISELAFEGQPLLIDAAKIAILAASTISAVSGYLFLRHRHRVHRILNTEIN